MKIIDRQILVALATMCGEFSSLLPNIPLDVFPMGFLRVTSMASHFTFSKLKVSLSVRPAPHVMADLFAWIIVIDFHLARRSTIYTGTVFSKPLTPSRYHDPTIPCLHVGFPVEHAV